MVKTRRQEYGNDDLGKDKKTKTTSMADGKRHGTPQETLPKETVNRAYVQGRKQFATRHAIPRFPTPQQVRQTQRTNIETAKGNNETSTPDRNQESFEIVDGYVTLGYQPSKTTPGQYVPTRITVDEFCERYGSKRDITSPKKIGQVRNRG